MSLISKALQKTQESRDESGYPKIVDIVYLSDSPKYVMVLSVVGAIAAILISITAVTITMKNAGSKQIQVLSLEKTIKNQEKRINDFITAINGNQKFTDAQINDIKTQMNNSRSTDNGHYSDLKDALLADKEEISYLENYTKDLKQKIEAMSVSNTQTEGK